MDLLLHSTDSARNKTGLTSAVGNNATGNDPGIARN